jgi:hypothetical protein
MRDLQVPDYHRLLNTREARDSKHDCSQTRSGHVDYLCVNQANRVLSCHRELERRYVKFQVEQTLSSLQLTVSTQTFG